MSDPRYEVSTWDPDMTPDGDSGWNLRWSGLTRWELRAAIREARSEGYSHPSILVERMEPEGGAP